MKSKDKEFINDIKYSENKMAKKIFRDARISKWIFYLMFLLETITYMLIVINMKNINGLIFYSVVYIIFAAYFIRDNSGNRINKSFTISLKLFFTTINGPNAYIILFGMEFKTLLSVLYSDTLISEKYFESLSWLSITWTSPSCNVFVWYYKCCFSSSITYI